jgi:starch phosphorylase
VLDGWWIEGCAENVTGWAITDLDDEVQEADFLYNKVEKTIAPLFADKAAFAQIRQHCIAMNGTFFNTHRMLGQYFANAYFPQSSSIASTDQEIVDDEAREAVLI